MLPGVRLAGLEVVNEVVEAAGLTRTLTIVVTAEGARVEGLDVETAAQLLARLR